MTSKCSSEWHNQKTIIVKTETQHREYCWDISYSNRKNSPKWYDSPRHLRHIYTLRFVWSNCLLPHALFLRYCLVHLHSPSMAFVVTPTMRRQTCKCYCTVFARHTYWIIGTCYGVHKESRVIHHLMVVVTTQVSITTPAVCIHSCSFMHKLSDDWDKRLAGSILYNFEDWTSRTVGLVQNTYNPSGFYVSPFVMLFIKRNWNIRNNSKQSLIT